MEVPKYVEEMIKRRERLAMQLDDVCRDLDTWLDKNDIETEMRDTHGGVEIYVNPTESAQRIREAIKKSSNKHLE
jgi:hypothetical protein